MSTTKLASMNSVKNEKCLNSCKSEHAFFLHSAARQKLPKCESNQSILMALTVIYFISPYFLPSLFRVKKNRTGSNTAVLGESQGSEKTPFFVQLRELFTLAHQLATYFFHHCFSYRIVLNQFGLIVSQKIAIVQL